MTFRGRVITSSTRTAAGVGEDTAGPIVVDGLRALGIDCADAVVVADGEPLLAALRQAIADEMDVVLTTGGTGHTPTDVTPEMTLQVLDRLSPGLAEAVRAYGVEHAVPTAVLSRGVAGLAGRTVIVNLPGSRGGARDGVAALSPVLLHLLDQVAGGDHPRD
jgi:molybdenum cofactor synthesis domain-containing protein